MADIEQELKKHLGNVTNESEEDSFKFSTKISSICFQHQKNILIVFMFVP